MIGFYPERINSQKSKYDPLVFATLSSVLNSFFTSELRVLATICDSSDGKHKNRNKLFSIWHKRCHPEMFIHKPVELLIGNETLYGNIFVRFDFPHMNVLNSYLIDNALDFILAKFLP